ncbi:uncharacterized protein LOC126889766 isoform X2 [Diabrotica virgifera virgifera]|uniref:ZAD domain-containing protein n=1 Tax=Diabrotica virgifera virgifera TaxID=50390 RepID=A0ABM5KVT8_DIAVI|nr:uncharacterized protein LOC126889766 isoform X2 [Diabrotica virgifera virgifera]
MDTGTAECRLCLSQEELVLVFNCEDVGPKKMNELILLTTGVEILENDVISKKICLNCSNTVIKMHEFREISSNSDRYLKEKLVELLKVTEMKIPNTDVTVTTRKQLIQEKQDDSNTNVPENTESNTLGQNKLDVSKEEDIDDFSHNSDVLRNVIVHESVSNLFSLHPNLKLRSGVLALDINPFVSLKLDAVEKYCNNNNINLKLGIQRPVNVNIVDKKTIPLPKNGFSDSNFRSETNILEDKESFKTPQSNQTMLNTTPFSIKLVDIQSKFKVDPINTSSNDPSKFKVVPKDFFKRTRESSESEVSVKDTQQGKFKKRKLLSSMQHFGCRFCKKKFRNSEYKRRHEQQCTIGYALNSKPYVELIRVDLDLKIRNKYLFNIRNKYLSNNTSFGQRKISPNEVIELSDNDESVLDSTTITSVATEPSSIEKMGNECETKSKNPPTIDILGDEKYLPRFEVSNTPNEVVPANVLPVQYLSTSIVRPTILIRNDSLLNGGDMYGSDIALVKELIQNSKQTVRYRLVTKNTSLQTLASKDITSTFTLKNMFSQLKLYKVPIKIRSGEHSVTTSKPEIETEKEVDGWHDIKPVLLTNTNSIVDINNMRLRPLRTKKKDSLWTYKIGTASSKQFNYELKKTNKKASFKAKNLKCSISSQTPQTIGNGVKENIIPDSSKMSLTQEENKVCSQNTSSTIITPPSTITPPNAVQTVFSQNNGTIIANVYNQSQVNLSQTLNSSVHMTNNYTEQIFTPDVLNNTSNVQQMFIPTNNTLNSHAGHLQILSHTLNNALVNNIDNNSQQMFIPLSSNSINSANCIPQLFGSSNGTVMAANNQSSILIPIMSPMVSDGSIPNLNVITPSPMVSDGSIPNFNVITPSPMVSDGSIPNFNVITQSPMVSDGSIPNLKAIAPRPMASDGSIPNLKVIAPKPMVSDCSIPNLNVITPSSMVSDGSIPNLNVITSSPMVSDGSISNLNVIGSLSTVPNPTNVGFTYSFSNNTQNTVSLVNNTPIIVNSSVGNCNITSNMFTSNEVQQNMLSSVNLAPNNITDSLSTSTSVVQSHTPVLSNNFTIPQPLIRVKNIYELK